MKRLLIGLCGLLAAGLAYVWLATPAPLGPLTPKAIATLEPEICGESSLTIALTSIVPMLPPSVTKDMSIEQIALVDQYKGTDRRKVWVLRLPAAYITHRTCDSGRKNWHGQGGDDIRVSQRYEIAILLNGEDVMPVTRAGKSQLESGVPVTASLVNSVGAISRVRNGFGRMAYVNNTHNEKQPLKCREEESDVPGLVVFKRIETERPGGIHCGGTDAEGTRFATTVFGRKSGEREYEFVAVCSVNCRIFTEYQGWRIEAMIARKHLAHWPAMQSGIRGLLERSTLHIDLDDGAGPR